IPVINRGFGGSTMAETRDALRRIVIPLNPKAVIVYAGSHDLHGPKGKTPEQVAEEFAELCRELRAAQPDVRIGFISCKPSLAKWENIDRDRRLNTLIQNFVAHEPAVFYIDLWSALAPPEGQLPDPRWFQADRNHLSPDAYQELAILVRRALMSEGIAAEVPDR
ncbi:MAG TPA: GDSL-type esterase/lipase family protein, partial [Tepidisphaeraceae bacterium]